MRRKKERKWRDRQGREAKTEEHVWRVVNRGRKVKKRVNNEISMEQWKDHFKGLVGGV